MPRRLDGAPEVATVRQRESPAVEFSKARPRSKKKKQVDRPGAQSRARIARAECQDSCLALGSLPVEFQLPRRIRRSRYRFHTAPGSISATRHKPPRWHRAVV